MGILDRLFAKKESATEETMSLCAAKESMNDKLQRDYGMIAEALKSEREQMLIAADSMQNYVNILDKAKYPERTYPIIISKSIVSRKNFVIRMNLLVRQIRMSIDCKMESTLEFYENLGKTIDSINSETIKDYAFLKMLFEKEGKDVVDTFRQISDINKGIVEMLKPIINAMEMKEKAGGIVDEIVNINEEIGRDNPGRIAKDISEMQNELFRAEKELEDLLAGEEWKFIIGLQKKAEISRGTMSAKRRDFERIVDGIEGPLKKYKRISDSHLLDDYISKSFDSILCDDPTGERAVSLLESIKETIIDGKIEIKDREQTLGRIGELVDGNAIGKIVQDYLTASEEAKSSSEKASSSEVMRRKLSLDSDLARLENKIEESKSEMKKAGDIAITIVERRLKKAKQLEEIFYDIFKKRIKVNPEST